MNTSSLRRLFCLLALLLLLPSLSQAATRKVPSQYPTIQAGINAAYPGDTVLVADGTYTGDGNRDLSFFGKSITIKSEHGPTKTVIDCQGTHAAPHYGLSFRNYTNEACVLDGLTVKNGVTPGSGAAINCGTLGPLLLRNCFFQNNSCGGEGGAVYAVNNSSVTLSYCSFHGNTVSTSSVSYGYGGGVFIVSLDAKVDHCSFSENTVVGGAGYGGGCAVENTRRDSRASVTLSSNTFTDNTAFGKTLGSKGGGVYVEGNNVSLSQCSFSGNMIAGYSTPNILAGGGGAYVSSTGGPLLMDGCAFEENTAGTGHGGGAYLDGDSLTTTVQNCAFRGNTAYGNNDRTLGGGIVMWVKCEALKLTNSTFSGNTILSRDIEDKGYGFGGGAYINSNDVLGQGTGSVTVMNCSFFGSQAILSGFSQIAGAALFGEGGGAAILNHAGLVQVTNCIAWGDSGFQNEFYFFTSSPLTAVVAYSDIGGSITGAVRGVNNFKTDPRFVNEATGDLHLQPTSPCLSKGTRTGAPATDKDGRTRPNPPSIGAYDVLFALQSLTLSPASVFGGQTSTATLTLARPAPAGGTNVTLSSNTGYAVVPPSVTVPAGLTSKTFTVTSNPVTTIKAATISVSYGGVTKTASLLIYPPSLASLTLNPTTVKGGKQNSVGMVTLTSAAPAGGTVVSVGSNTGYAIVPTTITVPAGGKSAAFTVVTKPVSANKGATITATLANVSKSAGLLLTP